MEVIICIDSEVGLYSMRKLEAVATPGVELIILGRNRCCGPAAATIMGDGLLSYSRIRRREEGKGES